MPSTIELRGTCSFNVKNSNKTLYFDTVEDWELFYRKLCRTVAPESTSSIPVELVQGKQLRMHRTLNFEKDPEGTN